MQININLQLDSSEGEMTGAALDKLREEFQEFLEKWRDDNAGFVIRCNVVIQSDSEL